MPSPVTCCTTAPTCAWCRRCSATPTSRPPRSTPMFWRTGSRAWFATCIRSPTLRGDEFQSVDAGEDQRDADEANEIGGFSKQHDPGEHCSDRADPGPYRVCRPQGQIAHRHVEKGDACEH